jgi:hypothetical protein
LSFYKNQRFLIFLVGLVSFLNSIALAIEKNKLLKPPEKENKRISGQILFFSFSGQNDV